MGSEGASRESIEGWQHLQSILSVIALLGLANLLLVKPSLRTTQAHQAVAPFVLATNLGLLRRGGAAGVAPEGPSSLQLTEGICIAKGFTIEHGESRWSKYSHLVYMQLGLRREARS